MTALVPDFDLPDAMKLRLPQRPGLGNAEFRAAMAAIGSSVHVVTARRGDERIGRTVTSLLSLSAEPPTLLISIDIMSRMADFIAKTGGFSVALLASDQAEIADAFAGRVEAGERFERGQWGEWQSGHPMLAGAVSTLDCEVIGAIETGTHVLFAGAVVDADVASDRTPLIWQRKQYHTLVGLD